jgi:hypothetical protein
MNRGKEKRLKEKKQNKEKENKIAQSFNEKKDLQTGYMRGVLNL